MGVRDRFKKAFSVFSAKEDPDARRREYELTREAAYGSGIRPDRSRSIASNERTTIASVYTRLGIDVATVDIRHVRLNEEDQYVETIRSDLNYCLTVSANIDQPGSAFRQDIAMSLFEWGTLAIVPVKTSDNPDTTGSYDIYSLRVGQIVDWYPQAVKVKLYNEDTGQAEEIVLAKDFVAIVENPLYSVMNETNSTLKRITRKLNLLDAVDDAASSGKLDILIQLPYAIKGEIKQEQAEKRRQELEDQMRNSKYGIGYIDGVERITQLNRPAENNMLAQIKWLTEKLYAELGLAQSIFDGTADEAAMLNYNNRTIEPILRAITESMHRTFLTKTAQTQLQAIRFIRDPFKLVPISEIAEIADKFTRNEILSSNEIRSSIGFRPSKDPKANELRNSNMPQALDPGSYAQEEEVAGEVVEDEEKSSDVTGEEMDRMMEEIFNQLEADADDIINKANESD